jgi:hypothetical protein
MTKTSQLILSARHLDRIRVVIPVFNLVEVELNSTLARAIAYSAINKVENRNSFLWDVYKSTSHRKDLTFIALLVRGPKLEKFDQILVVDFSIIGEDSFKQANPEFVSEVIKNIKYLL